MGTRSADADADPFARPFTDPFADATTIAGAIREGRTGSRAVVEAYLDRIERWAALNAVVTVDAGAARSAADACDRAVRAGDRLGPLHGVPMTVKDAFAVAGMRSTSGLAELAGDVPAQDALVVARLRAAGAIVMGKSNVPPGITGQETANELFGRTLNPWDRGRTPGGSSGGAAAALAAGLTAAELGSDSGGSIRQPAHCCGVLGHVPTHGLVPTRGHRPQADEATAGKDVDLMTIGPLARSAPDLRLLLGVVAGPDPAVDPGWRVDLPREDRPLTGLRVAAWLDDPAHPTDRAVLDVLEALADGLERAGVAVDRAARPGFALDDAVGVALQLWTAASSDRTPAEDVERLRGELATGALHGLARLRARGETMSHRDWLRLDGQRRALQRQWQRFFDAHDVLLCPVIPVVAPRHDPELTGVPSVDHRLRRTIDVDGTARPYLDQLTWSIVPGMAGLPATVAPAGLSAGGLPVGVQIVGRRHADLTTIAVAEGLAALTGGFRAPPGCA
ncbi:MAG: amidase family protein [Frankiaceae bacterium]